MCAVGVESISRSRHSLTFTLTARAAVYRRCVLGHSGLPFSELCSQARRLLTGVLERLEGVLLLEAAVAPRQQALVDLWIVRSGVRGVRVAGWEVIWRGVARPAWIDPSCEPITNSVSIRLPSGGLASHSRTWPC